MLYHNVQVTAHSLRFIDALATAASASGAWYVGFRAEFWPVSEFDALFVYVGINVVAFLALSSRMHVYYARRMEELSKEIFVLCEVALYSTGLACLATQTFTRGLPGTAYFAMLATALLTLVTLRLAMRLVIRNLRRKGDDARIWLIIGYNRRAGDIAAEVLRNPHYGIRIDKIIDFADALDRFADERSFFEASPPRGVKLGTIDDIEDLHRIVSERVIDEVVVTLPVRSYYDVVNRILEICGGAGISVRLRPQVFETAGYAMDMSYVGNIPLVTHYSGPSNYDHLLLKRAMDVLGAAVGLVLLAPFLVVVATVIRWDSPGPALFRQTRVGLHGRHFEMLKFRSMFNGAHAQRDDLAGCNERDGLAFKIRNDSRITRVGKTLRKYHIDELPQLWNVLVGDMSLVGPRPLPVQEAHGNEWWQRRRLSMPPGLTCYWQLRDNPNIPFLEWMRLDLAYIDGWSIWLDMKLIAQTLRTVFRGNGW